MNDFLLQTHTNLIVYDAKVVVSITNRECLRSEDYLFKFGIQLEYSLEVVSSQNKYGVFYKAEHGEISDNLEFTINHLSIKCICSQSLTHKAHMMIDG